MTKTTQNTTKSPKNSTFKITTICWSYINLKKKNGKNVYTLFENGVRYRVITGENRDGERIITYYSNRQRSGLGHTAENYTFSTTPDDVLEGILTFQPKTNFKDCSQGLKKGGFNQPKHITKKALKKVSLY